jgi:hypothetical protein
MAAMLEKVDATSEPCVALLAELGVESTTYAHPLATTVEEQAQHVVGIEVRTQERPAGFSSSRSKPWILS